MKVSSNWRQKACVLRLLVPIYVVDTSNVRLTKQYWPLISVYIIGWGFIGFQAHIVCRSSLVKCTQLLNANQTNQNSTTNNSTIIMNNNRAAKCDNQKHLESREIEKDANRLGSALTIFPKTIEFEIKFVIPM